MYLNVYDVHTHSTQSNYAIQHRTTHAHTPSPGSVIKLCMQTANVAKVKVCFLFSVRIGMMGCCVSVSVHVAAHHNTTQQQQQQMEECELLCVHSTGWFPIR